MTIKEIINQDFRSSLNKAVQKAKMNLSQTGFLLQFFKDQSYLFLYEKAKQPQKAHFTQLIGQKMIALGITASDLSHAFLWLKSICRINHNLPKSTPISFLIFDSKAQNAVIIGVCVNGSHIESFQLWDLINQYRNNFITINT